MSQEVVSTTPCPTCAAFGQVKLLRARTGKFAQYCEMGHEFSDSEQLHAQLEMAKKQFPHLYADPSKARGPVEPLPDTYVIDMETRESLQELLGSKIESVSELKGAIYALYKENEGLTEANKRLQSKVAHPSAVQPEQETTVPGRIGLTLPEWAISLLEDWAQTEQKSLAQVTQEQFVAWLEQFSTVPQQQG